MTFFFPHPTPIHIIIHNVCDIEHVLVLFYSLQASQVRILKTFNNSLCIWTFLKTLSRVILIYNYHLQHFMIVSFYLCSVLTLNPRFSKEGRVGYIFVRHSYFYLVSFQGWDQCFSCSCLILTRRCKNWDELFVYDAESEPVPCV